MLMSRFINEGTASRFVVHPGVVSYSISTTLTEITWGGAGGWYFFSSALTVSTYPVERVIP
ncbi:hypothetical protein P3T37_000060 [Kitasatospora sp. MAA4]|nr:hypothetical protein [Kitasatospora sp. MAA4]